MCARFGARPQCYYPAPLEPSTIPPHSFALLPSPAWEGARRLLVARLDELRRAHHRFGHDDEALHDFRVALRRLRSTLSAWQSTIAQGVVGKPRLARRRLRTLARETSLARDAEVQRALLDDEVAQLGAVDDSAARLLLHEQAEELRSSEQLHYAELKKAWHEMLPVLERLRRRLRWCRVDLEAEQPSFQRVLGMHITARAAVCKEATAVVELARDQSSDQLMDHAHRLRISVKHVRYALDPVAELEHVAPLIKQLKRLQDDLGLLHDVALAEARPLPEPSFARPATPTADDAARRLQAHWAHKRITLFTELDRQWLAGGRAALLWGALATVGKKLESAT